jgi:hypothetical protein
MTACQALSEATILEPWPSINLDFENTASDTIKFIPQTQPRQLESCILSLSQDLKIIPFLLPPYFGWGRPTLADI